MAIKFRNSQEGTKVITQVGDFRVNESYHLTSGYYRGKLMKLVYISPNKQVMIDQNRCRLVSGELVEGGLKINTVLEHLEII